MSGQVDCTIFTLSALLSKDARAECQHESIDCPLVLPRFDNDVGRGLGTESPTAVSDNALGES